MERHDIIAINVTKIQFLVDVVLWNGTTSW